MMNTEKNHQQQLLTGKTSLQEENHIWTAESRSAATNWAGLLMAG